MFKKFNNYKILIIINILLLLFLYPSCIFAGALKDTSQITAQEEAFNREAGFVETETIGSVIASVIKGFLGLLGIIFVILIIIGGFNWMNSGGNEEKVTKAKNTLRYAIIGLIIVVSAYAITFFVFTNLGGVSGVGPSTTVSP